MKEVEPGKSLGSAQSDEVDVLAQVHVRLFAPIPSADESSAAPMHGYYRNLGMRSAPHRVKLLVAGAIDDGEINWSDTEWKVVNPSDLDATIQSCIKPVTSEGVWYASGRVYYSDIEDSTPGRTRADSSKDVRPR